MGRQSQVFLSGEGAAWLKRNAEKLPVKNDPVIRAIMAMKDIAPKNILEIGCANGWRLKQLTKIYLDCAATGVDPVIDNDHMEDGVVLTQGTAERLRFFPNTFDIVIFGWCLYLCDQKPTAFSRRMATWSSSTSSPNRHTPRSINTRRRCTPTR